MNDKESSNASEKLVSEKVLPSTKTKKGPLPMKMRALPQSFWQQPNTLAEVSPTSYCPSFHDNGEESSRCEVVGVANTELLFSLFQSVESGKLESSNAKQLPVRRGRPRKEKLKARWKVKKDADPYFTSATVPCIQTQEDDKFVQREQVLAMMSVTGEDGFPTVNSGYSERLSKLVVNL